MSDAPERIWATEDRKNYGEDRFHTTRPMRGLTEYIRADLSDALLREALEALHQYVNDMRYPPERDSRDRRIAWAQATLAKLRAHMDGDGNHP